ncbi:MAG: hypothetical protein SPL05_07350 [Eubacteriales bacterium]|nr:hypothetical protein [Eubacteriales bacterium]
MEQRIEALEQGVAKLRRSIQHLDVDESQFSNDYFLKQQKQEQVIRALGQDLANAAHAKIGEARIEKAAIGTAHIQEGAIANAHIQNGAITNAKIANLAVDSAKLAEASVGNAHIQNGAIDSAKIANLVVQTANIALGAITEALIAKGAVGSAQIADASITDAKIVELTANKITAGVLEVARLIITGENSIVEQINAQNHTEQGSNSTIDGGAMTERSITADKLVANSITAREIASKSITANEILANSITGDCIASDTVEARRIKAGEISTDKLSANIGEELYLESNTAIQSRVLREELDGYVDKDEFGRQIGTVVSQTQESITQSVTEMLGAVSEVDGKLADYQSMVNVWQRFSSDGLELGRSDSKFAVKLTNEKLSFTENGEEIAYFANSRMHIKEAEASKGLLIGNNYDFVANADGMTLMFRSE